MNGMIALDALLQEATATHFRNLVTRSTGAAVRDRVVRALRDRPRTEALLDFSRIGLIDFSCADEVVAKLIQALQDLPVTRVVLSGVREDHAEAIDHALRRHGLLILALDAEHGEPRLLGEAPDDWLAVFEAIKSRTGPTDLAGIVALLAWQPARAARALDGLMATHCLVLDSEHCYHLGVLV